MKNLFLSALAAMLMVTSTIAVAGTTVIQREGYVIKSAPIWSTDTQSIPKKTCRTVDVPIYGQTQSNGASAGDVLGGMIIGGLLGKGVSGNDKGAAAGAIIGGMVSADKGKQSQRVIIGYQQQQQCSTEYVQSSTRRIDGYLTVVEVPSLDYFRYEFISQTQYQPREKVMASIRVNAGQ